MAETYNTTRDDRSDRRSEKQADLVIVMVHWGTEYTDQPEPYQVKEGPRNTSMRERTWSSAAIRMCCKASKRTKDVDRL